MLWGTQEVLTHYWQALAPLIGPHTKSAHGALQGGVRLGVSRLTIQVQCTFLTPYSILDHDSVFGVPHRLQPCQAEVLFFRWQPWALPRQLILAD